MTSAHWSDRIMGGNKQLDAHHNLTVILTGGNTSSVYSLQKALGLILARLYRCRI
jgi:hypothetical protein